MPKSKKPRHRYRTKIGTNFTAVRRPQLDNLHEIFTDLELKIETLLHRGECSVTDLRTLLDLINWALVAVSTRSWYTTESRLAASEMLQAAGRAIDDVYERGITGGGMMVCRADELNLIRDAAEFAGNLMHRSLEETPVRTVKEWDAARECSKGAIPGQPNQMSVRKLQKLLGSR